MAFTTNTTLHFVVCVAHTEPANYFKDDQHIPIATIKNPGLKGYYIDM